MSEKEDKEGHPTQQLTRQQREPNPATTEPTHCNNWPNPLQQLNQLAATTGPSPIPSPVGRGVISEIPLTSCCSLFTVLVGLM